MKVEKPKIRFTVSVASVLMGIAVILAVTQLRTAKGDIRDLRAKVDSMAVASKQANCPHAVKVFDIVKDEGGQFLTRTDWGYKVEGGKSAVWQCEDCGKIFERYMSSEDFRRAKEKVTECVTACKDEKKRITGKDSMTIVLKSQ